MPPVTGWVSPGVLSFSPPPFPHLPLPLLLPPLFLSPVLPPPLSPSLPKVLRSVFCLVPSPVCAAGRLTGMNKVFHII